MSKPPTLFQSAVAGGCFGLILSVAGLGIDDAGWRDFLFALIALTGLWHITLAAIQGVLRP